ncbi:MAG: Gfo/Idh/MocA family oxidoreductase, partial [Chloroflexi bacterium]|nr:Gfo/Idh/MocA family oxidoreductase [Chloroflexota bacterium]
MRVAIVGCGLVGQKRAAGLGEHTLVSCFDQDHGRAEALAAKFSTARAVEKLDTVLENGSIDAVIVATTHDSLASVGLRAICAGKHVLIEKPGARTPEELSPLLEAAAAQHVTVKIGFNHRFHPSIRQARHMLVNGEVGELMYIRARYGHGGRPGYEREWRADPAVSGGGELLDQGSHLIDLSRWFGGDVVDVQGDIGTWYWPMPVEDNAFVRLRMQNGSLAWLHASWTEWKNLFSF